jgi:hypothetical protein
MSRQKQTTAVRGRPATGAPQSKPQPEAEASQPAPVMATYKCISRSSIICHPQTGAIMVRGEMGEVKHFPIDTYISQLLSDSVQWENVNHPRARDAGPPRSYRKVGAGASE